MGARWLWHGGSSWSWSVHPSAVTMSPRRKPRGHRPAPWHPAFQAPSTGSGASTEGTSDRMSQQQPQPHPMGPWDGVIPWALSPCGCVTSRDIVTLRDVIAVWGSSAPGTSSPCGDATLWGTVTPRDIITVWDSFPHGALSPRETSSLRRASSPCGASSPHGDGIPWDIVTPRDIITVMRHCHPVGHHEPTRHHHPTRHRHPLGHRQPLCRLPRVHCQPLLLLPAWGQEPAFCHCLLGDMTSLCLLPAWGHGHLLAPWDKSAFACLETVPTWGQDNFCLLGDISIFWLPGVIAPLCLLGTRPLSPAWGQDCCLHAWGPSHLLAARDSPSQQDTLRTSPCHLPGQQPQPCETGAIPGRRRRRQAPWDHLAEPLLWHPAAGHHPAWAPHSWGTTVPISIPHCPLGGGHHQGGLQGHLSGSAQPHHPKSGGALVPRSAWGEGARAALCPSCSLGSSQ